MAWRQLKPPWGQQGKGTWGPSVGTTGLVWFRCSMLLLENAILFPSGDLNAVLGGTGLEGMSQRGLWKRREGKKKWENVVKV